MPTGTPRSQGLGNTVIYESQIRKAQSFYPASQLSDGRPFISLTFTVTNSGGETPQTCHGKEAKGNAPFSLMRSFMALQLLALTQNKTGIKITCFKG